MVMSNDFYYFCIFSEFCFGHGHSSTTTTQVHSPFARKYGGLSLSVVRDTPEGTKEYITLILGMSYGSAMLAHFTLRGIFMEFEKRSDS